MLFPGNQFEEMQLMRSPNLPEHHGFNIGPTRSICRITAMKSADMAPTRIGVFLQCRKNEYYWLCNYGVKNSYTLYFYGIVVQYKHNWYNSGHNCRQIFGIFSGSTYNSRSSKVRAIKFDNDRYKVFPPVKSRTRSVGVHISPITIPICSTYGIFTYITG